VLSSACLILLLCSVVHGSAPLLLSAPSDASPSTAYMSRRDWSAPRDDRDDDDEKDDDVDDAAPTTEYSVDVGDTGGEKVLSAVRVWDRCVRDVIGLTADTGTW
jgi:hypothetical protein